MSRPLALSTPEERLRAGLARRRRAEIRFRFYGIAAVMFALSCLIVLFLTIFSNGWSAFRQTEIDLELFLDGTLLDPGETRTVAQIRRGDFQGVVRAALREYFPEATGRRDRKALYALVSAAAAAEVRTVVLADPDLIGRRVSFALLASDDADLWMKGQVTTLSARQVGWMRTLRADGAAVLRFNQRFFVNGDSREPERAGILGAVAGSFWMLLVTLLLSFPIGVLAAIYLEEFAPKNRFTDLIEVNINNLAAVPSSVFGILGLALFLNLFGMPRSAPLVGGLVLSLMTLPTIVITSRAALKTAPGSIRQAALGLGATRLQMVMHQVLPLAMPGILTGAIIGMAQALGETAPLLMIGMVAFIADIPGGPLDPAAALPVQIYLWADSPERAFVARMSAAIIVLLAFLVTMNLLAVWLRRKFEKQR